MMKASETFKIFSQVGFLLVGDLCACFGSGLDHLVPRKLYEKTKNPYSSSEMKDSEMGFTQKDASQLLL